MPLAHEILLLHEAGPDRQALASYLERQGLKTTVCEEARHALAHMGKDGAAQKTLVLVQQNRIASPSRSANDAFAPYQTVLIVPSGAEPIPGFEHVLREPFFLDQVISAIRRASGDETEPAPAAGGPGGDEHLLRGIAHAINNPLAAALGWLRLLDAEIDDRDRKKRLVVQARTELERLGDLAQALALVGSPPPASVTFDLGMLVGDKVHQAALEGSRVVFRPARAQAFHVSGNPLEYDLVVRLFLVSAVDSKSLDQLEFCLDDKSGQVQLSVRDPRGIVPGQETLEDLGRLLRAERHSRAMAIALSLSITRRAGGWLRVEAGHPRGATYVLSVPAASRGAQASKGAP